MNMRIAKNGEKGSPQCGRTSLSAEPTSNRHLSPETGNSLSTILAEIRNFEPADLLSGQEPLVIYGAGGFGRDVAKALLKQERTVLGFLDRNGANQVDGLPCRSPEAN